MNNTEQRIYNVTNAYIGYGRKEISKKEVDTHYADVINLFEDELSEIDIEMVRVRLYDFWGIDKSEVSKIYSVKCGLNQDDYGYAVVDQFDNVYGFNLDTFEDAEHLIRVCYTNDAKGIPNQKLVPMPVNKKAQDEYNKRFGVK